MLFETDRLYVAKWRKENLNALYDLFNDPAIKEFIAPKLTIATEVVNETVNWLFTEKGFSNICAITELDNIDSQNVLIKAGFIRQKDILDDGKMMSYFLNSKNEE